MDDISIFGEFKVCHNDECKYGMLCLGKKTTSGNVERNISETVSLSKFAILLLRTNIKLIITKTKFKRHY